MLNIPDSLLTKMGQFKVLECNKATYPLSILPQYSSYVNNWTDGFLVDELGDWAQLATKSFSMSIEVNQTNWASGSSHPLVAWSDASGNNGIVVTQGSDDIMTVAFMSGGSPTVALTYDASGSATGKHQVGIVRVVGVSQKLYFDGALVDTDTVTTDTIGLGTAMTSTISTVSKTSPISIATVGDHGLSDNDVVTITGLKGTMDLHGVDTLNGSSYIVTKTGARSFTIPVNGIQFDSRTSGGTCSAMPIMSGYVTTGSTDQLVTRNVLTANDMKILYYINRNSMTLLDASGNVAQATII